MKTVAIESDCMMYWCAINMINILSATKCRPMILVSRNIKYMQIFEGVSSSFKLSISKIIDY